MYKRGELIVETMNTENSRIMCYYDVMSFHEKMEHDKKSVFGNHNDNFIIHLLLLIRMIILGA